VDPGSNVHIITYPKFLHDYRTTKNKVLGQVSGDKKAVLGISNWHIHIDGHSVVLHDVLCMPDNPSCTLSTTGALKRLDGFVYAAHDALAQLQLVCPIGINKAFHTKDNTLKSLNGLDYVPMITLLPQESKIDAGYENCEGPQDPNVDPDSAGYMCANRHLFSYHVDPTKSKESP